ncbi:MAG: hypothetical protein HYZ75_16175, partial [Elusimicrobia bacterium]|nr:hypothetical protein [Elusimicrobiota bacterium]
MSRLFHLRWVLAALLGTIVAWSAQALELGDGTTEFPPARLIAQNGNGFWAFFNGNGVAQVTFSEDGILWTTPSNVFSSNSGLKGMPSIFYVDKTSTVYVFVGPSATGGQGLLTKADLTSPAIPSAWPTAGQSIDLKITGSGGAPANVDPRGEGQYSMIVTLDPATGLPDNDPPNGMNHAGWIGTASSYDGGGGMIKRRVSAVRFNASNLLRYSSVNNAYGDVNSTDLDIAKTQTQAYVVQASTKGEVMVIYNDEKNTRVNYIVLKENGPRVVAQTQLGAETSSDPQPPTRYGSAVFTPSGATAGLVHAVTVDTTGDINYWRYDRGANSWSQPITNPIDSDAVALAHPAIGLTDDDNAYVVYKGSGSFLTYTKLASIRGVPTKTKLGGWVNVTSGDLFPSITGKSAPPIPPRVMYSSDTAGAPAVHFVSIFVDPPPVTTRVTDLDNITGEVKNSAGINSGVGDNGSRIVQVAVTGMTDFSKGPKIGVFPVGGAFADPDITVSSKVVHTSSVTFYLKVGQNATAGDRDVYFVNSDGQFSSLGVGASTLTITQPLSEVTFPGEGNGIASGFAVTIPSIAGTADFTPQSGQTSGTTAQLRITMLEDPDTPPLRNNFKFTGAAWTSLDTWLNASSSGTWNYLGFSDAFQEDGAKLRIESRGRTRDQGRGIPSSAIDFKIDKFAPTVAIITPAANSSNGTSFSSIDGTARDPGVGMGEMKILVCDQNGTKDVFGDDKCWNPGVGWGPADGTEYFFHSPGESPWAGGAGQDTGTVTFDIFSNDPTNWPAFVDGGIYRVQARAADKLVKYTTATDSNRNFAYDVTRPTLTVNSGPGKLLPLGAAAAPVWKNALAVDGTVEDNVIDAVLGERYVRMELQEEGVPKIAWGQTVSTAVGVASVVNWTYDLSGVTLENAFTYRAKLLAKDRANNSTGTVGVPWVDGYFKFDNSMPTAGLVAPTPGNGSAVNTLPAISGTANDNHAGASRVEYVLKNNAGACYDGAGAFSLGGSQCNPNDGAVLWQVANSTVHVTSATWHVLSVPWASGNLYTLYFRAEDRATNRSSNGTFQNSWSTRAFSYDTEPPTTSMTAPVDGAQYKDATAFPAITWEPPIDPGFSGINEIRFKMRRHSDGACWDPLNTLGGSASKWDDDAGVRAACEDANNLGGYFAVWTGGGESQTNFLLNSDLLDGASYQVMIRSRDNAGNYEVAVETFTFNFDNGKPLAAPVYPTSDVRLNWGNDATLWGGAVLPSIVGTVTDPSPTQPPPGKIALVEVMIERTQDQAHWDGALFVADGANAVWRKVWQASFGSFGPPLGGTFTWTHPNGDGAGNFSEGSLPAALQNGLQYKVRARATDLAGNVQLFGDSDSFARTWIHDSAKPETYVTSPNTDPVDALGTIQGTATDPGGGTIRVVRAAYRRVSGSSVGDERWWNPVTKTFTLDSVANRPPETAFATASLVGQNFTLTGASTPTFLTGITYQIFVAGIDIASNTTLSPTITDPTDKTDGGAKAASDASRTSFVYFTRAVPAISSLVNLPAADENYYRRAAGANQLTQVAGTATSGATLVAVQIIVSTTDAKFPGDAGDVGDNRCWDGALWQTCTAATPLHGLGAIAVNRVPVGGEWSYPFPGGFPGIYTDHRFKVRTEATDGISLFQDPITARTFYFDAGAPTPVIVGPDNAVGGYSQLVQLTGTAVDPLPGGGVTFSDLDATSVKFRIDVASAVGFAYSPGLDAFAQSPADAEMRGVQNGISFSTAPGKVAGNTLWQEGYRYRVRMTASDLAQNAAAPVDSFFRFDTYIPTGTLSAPGLNVGVLSSMTVLSGVVSDFDPDPTSNGALGINPTGIDPTPGAGGVQVSIQATGGLDSPNYFTGDCVPACWVSSPRWLDAGVQSNVDWNNAAQATWTYTSADLAGAITDNSIYTIRVAAKDRALNLQSSFLASNASSVTVRVDKTAPQAWIAEPGQGDPILGMTSVEAAYTPASVVSSGLSGTASDGPALTKSGFGVTGNDDIDIQLWYLSGGASYYWKTSPPSWTTAVSTLPVGVTGGANWSFNLAGVDFTTPSPAPAEQRYYVRVRARDNAVDPSSAAARNVSMFLSTVSFQVDPTAPVSTMTWPRDGLFVNAVTSITGTANADFSGISKVEVRLERADGGPLENWTGSSWTANSYWMPVSFGGGGGDVVWSTTTFIAAAFTNDQKYRVYVRVTDKAGNVRSPAAGGDIVFTYDDAPPSLSMLFPYAAPFPSTYTYANGSNADVVWEFHRASGAVSDPGTFAAGVTSVHVAIGSGPPTDSAWDWWDRATEDFTLLANSQIQWTTQVYTGGASWQYQPVNLFNGGVLKDGALYRVYVKACDRAGNCRNAVTTPGASAGAQTATFGYDVSKPTASLSSPPDRSPRTGLSDLSGVASDAAGPGASGVQAVYLAVQNTGDPARQWWNWGSPGSFALADPPPWPTDGSTPGSAWLRVATTSARGMFSVPWSTSTPPGMIASSNTYRVVAGVWDYTTNRSNNPTAAGVGYEFRVDDEAPVVVTTFPVTGAKYNAATLKALSGYAYDNVTGHSGVTSVEVLLKNNFSGSYWTGAGSTFEAPTDGYDNWVGVPIVGVSTGVQWSRSWPTLNDNQTYVLWTRATDATVNVSTHPAYPVPDHSDSLDANQYADGSSAISFLYDNLTPTSKVTAPSFGFVNNVGPLNTISGTAWSDAADGNGAQVDSVLLNLWCSGCAADNAAGWWTGTWGTTQPPLFFSASLSQPSWSRAFGSAWLDGYQYKVYSQAHDLASNTEPAEAVTAFVVDRTTPVAKVVFPAAAGSAGLGPVTVLGTANDRFCDLVDQAEPGGGNLLCVPGARDFQSAIRSSYVVVAIEDTSGGTCNGSVLVNKCWWNQTVWVDQTAAIFSTATFIGDSSGTWTYNLMGGALFDLRTYKVSAYAKDYAGNIQNNVTTNTFTADFSAPVSTITAPLNGTSPESLPQVVGTAQDTGSAGVRRVYAAYYRFSNPKAWWSSVTKDFTHPDAGSPPSPNDDASYWIQTATNNASPVAWTATGGSTPTWVSGQTYQIVVVSDDRGLNLEAVPAAINGRNRVQFTFTQPAPRSGIVGPTTDAHFRPSAVTITGTASDFSDGVELRLSDLTGAALVWDPAMSAWRPQGDYDLFSAVGVNFIDNGAGNINDWNYSLGSSSWTANGPFRQFTLEARGMIGALPESPVQGPVSFSVDNVNPAAGIVYPTALFYNAVTDLRGTATDNSDGFAGAAKTVYFRLKHQDGSYFNFVSSAYAASAANCTTVVDATCGQAQFTGGSSYQLFHGSITNSEAFAPDIPYTIEMIVKDRAANSGSGAPKTFTWDVTAPIAGVLQPVVSKPVNALAQVNGTAADFHAMYVSSFSIQS